MKLKLPLTILFFVLFFFFSKTYSFAEDQNFDISVSSTFQIGKNGTTKVTQNVKITNKKEYIYTPTYSIVLGYKDINNVKVSDSDGLLENSISQNSDGGKSIDIKFSKRNVGVGKENDFTLSFDTSEVAKKNGNIWEVVVPGLSRPDDFSDYSITLVVPDSFGPPTISKPAKNLSQVNKTYSFSKSEIAKSGIFLLFGQNQYYNLNLSYHISNSNIFPVKTEIALPPATSYQDIIINSISPKPDNVYFDSDGNMLATFVLAAKKKQTVEVLAQAKLYSVPRETEEFKSYPSDTLPQKFWESDDPKIKNIATDLKTPDKIYDYIVNTLSYDYGKVSDENIRIGGKNILDKPNFAVCLEFTDLFIALARASGIPARSVEGYARTENSKLKPLSLVKDVLHAWPEYYDSLSKKWIMIDPTWGNTTKGMDYFTSFDFDHVAFAVKGKSSTYPIPAGGYKFDAQSKDVHVEFATQDEFVPVAKNKIELKVPDFLLSGFPVDAEITINNLGNTTLAKSVVVVNSSLTPSSMEYPTESIPPFGSYTMKIHFEKTPFLTNSSHNVTILFNGTSIQKSIRVSMFPNTVWFIFFGGSILGLSIITIITYKSWRILIQRFRK